MAKNRYNTPPKSVPDYTPRGQKKVEPEIVLTFKPCLVCGKAIKSGYYGSWEGGGTCRKTCEAVYELQQGARHENVKGEKASVFAGDVYKPNG